MRRPPLVLAAGSMLHIDAFTLATVGAAAGFDAIGLRLSGEHAVEYASLASLARHITDLGLFVNDVEVYRISETPADPRPLIEAAAAVGARNLLVVSDLPHTPSGRGQTEQELGSLVRLCRDAGMGVGLEYMAWTNPCTSADATALAISTGASVLVDVLHHTRVGEGISEMWALAGSGRLGWVQICDAPAERPDDLVHEARHARLLPGEGHLPIAELLTAAGNRHTISVEVQSDNLATRLSPTDLAAALLRAALRVHPENTTG